MRKVYFFRIGAFSLINARVLDAMRSRFSAFEVCEVDVEREIVGSRPGLRMRAWCEAMIRYGGRIASQRVPPRDFFPRLPVVLHAVRAWSERHVDPEKTAFTFQTQSLFDARHEGTPHFLYTDHTYLANWRYGASRRPMPVPAGWRMMERELYHGACCNFTSSMFAAISLIEDYRVPNDRVACVHSGCNVDFPAEIPWQGRTGRRLLFVGVDWERKGGPELIEAFKMVRKSVPDATLHIVGCDPQETVPGVTVHGRLSSAEMETHYLAADVFCLPSRMDPAASVLAEAAGFALPVVATPVGGNLERVRDGETGFLREPGEIAEAIIRLIRDDALRRRMGERGREWVLSTFTWDAVMDRMAGEIERRLAAA